MLTYICRVARAWRVEQFERMLSMLQHTQSHLGNTTECKDTTHPSRNELTACVDCQNTKAAQNWQDERYRNSTQVCLLVGAAVRGLSTVTAAPIWNW
jgi:hypothetical protein